MKKLCLLATCLLFAGTASAQLVNGDWATGTEAGWDRWQAPWGGPYAWAVTTIGPASPEGNLQTTASGGSFGWTQEIAVPSGWTATVSADWNGNIGAAGWAEVMFWTDSSSQNAATRGARADAGAAADIAFKKDSWGLNPPTAWTWQAASLSPHPTGNGGSVVSSGYVVVGLKLGTSGNAGTLDIDNIVVSAAAPPKNPVLVDPSGSGDYTTIAAAIASFCSGGANVASTPPYVINITPGTYDEWLTLRDVDVGQGDIQGSIVLQSSVAGTRPVIKLQKHPTLTNALEIFTNSYNVTFNDLLLCPSTTGTLTTSALVHVDQTGADAVYDTLAFNNCIFTQVDPAGNPWITTRQQAYTPPANWTSPVPMTYQLYFYPDAGEPKNLSLDNCVFYCSYGGGWGTGMTGTHLRTYQNTAGDTTTINNCVFAYSGNYSVMLYGTAAGVTNITGTDQTEGPDNCTYFLQQWEVDNHNIMIGAATLIVNVSDAIIRAHGPELTTTAGTQGTRSIAGGGAQLTIADAIIYNECGGGAKNGLAAVVDTLAAGEPESWNRVTVWSRVAQYYNVGTNAGTLTVRDCIFSGPSNVWVNLLAGAVVDVDYSAYVENGPDAILARNFGGLSQTDGANIVNADPLFWSRDASVALGFDVGGAAYATAGTGGAPLAGGADFVLGVQDWTSY